MPVKNYSLLKCRPLHYGIGTGHSPSSKPKRGTHPQFQILVEGAKNKFHRVAINIISDAGSTANGASNIRMRYYADYHFPELTNRLENASLPFGFRALDSKPDGLSLDFVKFTDLLEVYSMKDMPHEQIGPNNDLQDVLASIVDEAMIKEQIMYVFGSAWTDRQTIFFAEEQGGIHDIHCNQANPKTSRHAKDNGTWQDGAILVYDETTKRWKALFLAFESQFSGNVIETDAKGNRLEEQPGGTAKPQPAAATAAKPLSQPKHEAVAAPSPAPTQKAEEKPVKPAPTAAVKPTTPSRPAAPAVKPAAPSKAVAKPVSKPVAKAVVKAPIATKPTLKPTVKANPAGKLALKTTAKTITKAKTVTRPQPTIKAGRPMPKPKAKPTAKPVVKVKTKPVAKPVVKTKTQPKAKSTAKASKPASKVQSKAKGKR